MKETPENLNDAGDPLLAALRERLGNYSAPPPPGAWAGIRQRLPAAARPWWRRSRPLLLLLALLLTIGLTGVLVSRQKSFFAVPTAPAARPTTTAVPAHAPRLHTSALISKKLASPPAAARPSPGVGPALPSAYVKPAALPAPQNAQGVTPAATSTSEPAHPKPRPPAGAFATTKSRSAANSPAAAGRTNRLITSNILLPATTAAQRRARRQLPTGPAGVGHPGTGPAFGKATPAEANLVAALATKPRPATTAAPRHQAARHLRQGPLAGFARLQRHRRLVFSKESASSQLGSKFRHRTVGKPVTSNDYPGSTAALSGAGLLATRPRPLAGLLPRRSSLGLPASALPATVAARPDSTRPAPPVRRWALLALAGPALSYRTLGPRPAAPTGSPDLAYLERPAAGLGAQVQVRRVLLGRWALAVGLGYQEYATRLALQLGDSAGSRHLNQRDTYRLLTLPVQLSYALGAPRGRLAKALLVGAEAGWYRGGRSTEGSDCGCQQQVYSAGGNPYRPWSLGLSLGLDLRYRVGSPASRWQWVVQPTGRYVLTSLAGANSLGFSTRHPFNAGLLTGFSWDIR